MRKGKMVAQGAHASLGAVLLIQSDWDRYYGPHAWGFHKDRDFDLTTHQAASNWLKGTFTKICVSVDSESELLAIEQLAATAGLPVKLITDAGHTEFHGVATRTCLAIGPAWADDIDKITGNLKLL